MSGLAVAGLILLLAIEILASYIGRIHSEFGKILSREDQETLEAWETLVEPHLGLSREHAALCAGVWQVLAMGLLALLLAVELLVRDARPGGVGAVVLALLLTAVFANQLIPSLLFNRTRGVWAGHMLWPIRLLLWTITPITVFIRFFYSVAALVQHQVGSKEEETPDVEALIEAGEEEGILEQSDRELVRSAVEFGDKLVRELMTPRPEIFAVPADITLEQFLDLLREHNFSRVPVYAGTLDNVTGIAFAHDLLQIADEDARTRTVATVQRPAVFVPETKRGYELLREMQRDKQHMCMVVDEYGSVSGVVTIENLLEEIVGEIRDEHEPEMPREEPQREPSGAWLVPGSFPVDQLGDLLGEPVELDEPYEAATMGGLVSEREGRIPLPGEVLVLEPAGLRIEVLDASTHRVERLRVLPPSLGRWGKPAED
ncbi:MAG: hemolysin family protein [Acidobacteriota bacterium]